MIAQSDFMILLDQVLREQGYFVIGCPVNSPRFFLVGEKVNKLMEFALSETFVVTERCAQSDWTKQNDLIAKLRPHWTRFPESKGGAFFKTKPEAWA
jgi:hypothetical protein